MFVYLVVPAEGAERQGAEDGAVLEEAGAQLAQGDREILEHGVGLAHHVHPLQEQPLSLTPCTLTTHHPCHLQPGISRHQLGLLQPHKPKEVSLSGTRGSWGGAILTSSLGASCNTTGVSSENRVWMAFATLSRLKGTAWNTKSIKF